MRMSTKHFAGRDLFRIAFTCLGVLWLPLIAPAQSVYSVNALGYVDLNLAPGMNLIANPFSASDNSVSNLFRGVPDGSYFLPWNAPSGGFGPTNYFTESSGWTDPTFTLLSPNGGFLSVPTNLSL